MMLCTTLYGWHWNQSRRGIGVRHFIVECPRVNHHIFSVEGEGEAIQAPWGWAIQIFTRHIIMRAVTRAFETHTVIAKRDGTTQMDTSLKQGNPVRAIAISDDCLRGQLILLSAPATLAVADSPQTANRDRRRKRLRDNRCFAISAASAPPPCNISYCCGVSCGFIGGVVILMMTHFLAW